MPQALPTDLSSRLLAWYDVHARRLPWRARSGRAAAPYRVWLSEVMLQQTTVAAVIPYFNDFVARWPTVEALAAAPLDDVLAAWAGLGYYARARNLHAAAQRIAADGFPDDEAGWKALPGIGDYTAAAIAAIAYDRPAVAVDGNVERVMARLFAVAEPLPQAKPRLRVLARGLLPDRRFGDFAQAMMDLGATVCAPTRPDCQRCPWLDDCAARRAGNAAGLPARAPKVERPLRTGVAFWTRRADGAILLRRRPPRGLLGGMMEIPSTPWRDRPWSVDEAVGHAAFGEGWHALPGSVVHVFTHFRLELTVLAGRAVPGAEALGQWFRSDALGGLALPTLMKKVVRHAWAQGGVIR